jgi:hypothetical protein
LIGSRGLTARHKPDALKNSTQLIGQTLVICVTSLIQFYGLLQSICNSRHSKSVLGLIDYLLTLNCEIPNSTLSIITSLVPLTMLVNNHLRHRNVDKSRWVIANRMRELFVSHSDDDKNGSFKDVARLILFAEGVLAAFSGF